MSDIAEVKLSGSRLHLKVSGFVLAVEGDVCRDIRLCGWPEKEASEVFGSRKVWDEEKMDRAAEAINKGLPVDHK